MKICLLLFRYFPQQGGSIAPYEIAHQLVSLGIDVSIIAIWRPNELENQVLNGIKIYRIPLHGGQIKRRSQFFLYARRTLEEIQPDLVHVYLFYGCFLLPLIAASKTRKWLLDIRTSFVFLNASPLVVKAINRLFGYHSFTFDGVGVLSIGIHEKVFGKTSKKPVNIIPLGANVSRFTKVGAERPLNIPREFYENNCLLIYQGAIAPQRRIDLMVEAFAKALSTISKIRLLIVGDGAALEDIKLAVARLGIDEFVIFTGQVPYEEMPSYMGLADIAISYIPITALYEHQPALKAVEYLAAGLPVVATDGGSNRYFITDEVGEFSDDTIDAFAKAIIRLYNRKDKFPIIKYKAIEIARKHDWSAITRDSVLPLYKRLTDM